MTTTEKAIVGFCIVAFVLWLLKEGYCGFSPNDLRCIGSFGR